MLDVNKSNFYKHLPDIVHYIETCDFTSFDFEMTGLTARDYRSSNFDTIDIRYDQYKNDASFCFPVQVG